MNDLTRFQGIGYRKEECDPALPDTGILGCGHGKFCQQDEASALGGFCMLNDPSSRRLNDLEYVMTYVCDLPASEGYPVCDCSGLDVNSGRGVMSCHYDDISFGYGCDDVIVSATFRLYFSDSKYTKSNYCYEFTGPSHQKVCVTYFGETLFDTCSIAFNGRECNLCTTTDEFVDFDCTNVGGTAGGTLLETSTIMMNCYLDPFTNATKFPYVPIDSGSAASFQPAMGQIGLVGSFMIFVLKGI